MRTTCTRGKLSRLQAIGLTAAAIGLVACGGGGGGGTPTADVNPNGIWEGSFTEAGVTYDLQGLVYDGYLIAFSSGYGSLYEGDLFVDGNSFTGNTRVYVNGVYSGTQGLTGSVQESSTMSGRTSDGASTFTLDYNPIYERDASLNSVAGTWELVDGAYTFTMTVNASGAISGGDSEGCAYSGSLSVPDAAYNIYGVSLNVANCGAENGSYSGYATLGDDVATNDTLVLTASNQNYVAVAQLGR